MTKHYALIRKIGKKQWSLCWLDGNDGYQMKDRWITDRALVERNRDKIANVYKSDKYSILEMEM